MSLRWTEEDLEAYLRGRAATSSDPARGRATLPIGGGERRPHPTRPQAGPLFHGTSVPVSLETVHRTVSQALNAPKGKAWEPTGEQTEEEEQIALFEWAAAMTREWPELKWLYHVPNGGSRGPAEAGRFRAMGVRRGVPDVALDVARGGYHGLRIEMKREHGGKTSPDQDRWIEHLRAEGYRAEVCHGWTAAARVIEEYMNGGYANEGSV